MNHRITYSFSIFISLIFLSMLCQGQSTVNDKLTIKQVSDGYPGAIITSYSGSLSGHPIFWMQNFGGTASSIAPTTANSILGTLIFGGYNGTNTVQNARIYVTATSDFSSGNHPSKMYFNIGGSATCCGSTRMVIDGVSGHLGIGTSAPATRLSVVSTDSDVLHLSKTSSNGGDNIYLAFSHANNTSASNARARIGLNVKTGGQGRLVFLTGSANNLSEQMRIDEIGNVGIGTTIPLAKLSVNGDIRAEEVKVVVDVNTVPDFVFDEDYQLNTLAWTEAYIKANHHLPEIPSAAEISENGLNLGDMELKLLQKIEELTLYIIQQNQKIENQQSDIQSLQQQIENINQKISND